MNNIILNDDELLGLGCVQLGTGVVALVLSGHLVKKEYWGKTTGNVVNMIGVGEIVCGGWNVTNAVIQKKRKKEREQYNTYEY